MTDCSPSVMCVLVCDSKNAVINLTVIDLAMSIMQIVWLRKQADYLTFASLVWGFIVGVVSGQSLLVQPAWLPLHINLSLTLPLVSFALPRSWACFCCSTRPCTMCG